MTNNFKQYIFPQGNNKWYYLNGNILFYLFINEITKGKELNKNIKINRIIINSKVNKPLWVYVNNDISPIIVNDTFDWDVSNIGTINHLYFIFSDKPVIKKYILNEENGKKFFIQSEDEEGKTLIDWWYYYFGSYISFSQFITYITTQGINASNFEQSSTQMTELFQSIDINNIPFFSDYQKKIKTSNFIIPAVSNWWNSIKNILNFGIFDWLKEVNSLISAIETTNFQDLVEDSNQQIIITVFYDEEND